MTFLELAKAVIQAADQALTAQEMWSYADKHDMTKELGSKGKTPWATLAARLYVEVRDNPKSEFVAIGRQPIRFGLKGKHSENSVQAAAGTDGDEKSSYSELDLHPLLVFYADSSPHFRGAKLKTIDSRKSKKQMKGVNEWIHPDIVGAYLPFKDYKNELLDLTDLLSVSAIRFYSFELKKELNTSNFRMHYFQAVSNSSWAHEGYLVALKIDGSVVEETRSLVETFGIGLIQLQADNVEQSEILVPAKQRAQLDLDAMDKLAGENGEFSSFLKSITKDIRARRIMSSEYDEVFSPEKMTAHIDWLGMRHGHSE